MIIEKISCNNCGIKLNNASHNEAISRGFERINNKWYCHKCKDSQNLADIMHDKAISVYSKQIDNIFESVIQDIEDISNKGGFSYVFDKNKYKMFLCKEVYGHFNNKLREQGFKISNEPNGILIIMW